jgi:SSS family solute:Na+ symporter
VPRLAGNTVELAIFAAVVGLVIALGLAAARWRRPATMRALDEWGLGGRAFGPVITFFLLGGDIYTAYTLVAVPALVYGVGAAGFFPVAFATMMFPLVFVTLPRMWSVAHVHGFVTPAEFVRARFGSPSLSALVAMAAIVATMPYLALQLIGMEVAFEAMGVNGRLPLVVAFALLAVLTFRSGLRAPALMAIVKDALILVVVCWLLVRLWQTGPGWAGVFHAAAARFAGSPSHAGGLLVAHAGQLDYVTLALGSALALFLYPHVLTGTLAARNRGTIKRTLAIMPVYTLGLAIIVLFAFVAISRGIMPSGGDPNTVIPRLFHALLGNAGAGVGYAALGVGALVPAAIMSIAAANLFTRSIYREFIRPDATHAQETRVSRWASLTVKLGAVAAILFLTPQFSIDLQLMGGVIILQILPAVVIGLYTAWFHRGALIAGVLAGLVTGLAMLYQIPGPGPDGKTVVSHFGGASWPLAHLGLDTALTVYPGLIALAVNLAVTTAGTLVLRSIGSPRGADITLPWHYVADDIDFGIRRMPELVDGRQPYEGRHSS